jgi:hypothetical protein
MWLMARVSSASACAIGSRGAATHDGNFHGVFALGLAVPTQPS